MLAGAASGGQTKVPPRPGVAGVPPPKKKPPSPKQPKPPIPRTPKPWEPPAGAPDPGDVIATAPGTAPTPAWQSKAPGKYTSSEKRLAYVDSRLAAEKDEFEHWMTTGLASGWKDKPGWEQAAEFRKDIQKYLKKASKAGTGKTAIKYSKGRGAAPRFKDSPNPLARMSDKEYAKVAKVLKDLNGKLTPSSQLSMKLWANNLADDTAAFWYGEGKNIMAIRAHKASDEVRRLVWHEAGHALEDVNPKLKGLRLAYIKRRVANVKSHVEKRVRYVD